MLLTLNCRVHHGSESGSSFNWSWHECCQIHVPQDNWDANGRYNGCKPPPLAWAASAPSLSHDSQTTTVFRVRKPLSMGSFLMERIFRSTPDRVLTAHTEWLPGEHWCDSSQRSTEFDSAAVLFIFLSFRLITSKFIYWTGGGGGSRVFTRTPLSPPNYIHRSF